MYITQKTITKNPIYLFYEQVDTAADGTPGKDGDKHYKCHLGGRKVLTITRAMKSSLNGNLLQVMTLIVFLTIFSLRVDWPYQAWLPCDVLTLYLAEKPR